MPTTKKPTYIETASNRAGSKALAEDDNQLADLGDENEDDAELKTLMLALKKVS